MGQRGLAWTRRGFLRRATGAAGALGAVPLSAAAQSEAPAQSLICQMQVRGLTDPRLFDQSEPGNIARGTLETLLRYTQDFKLVPWLAEDTTTSDDGHIVTLFLRKGVSWSNGDPFTSEDVLVNFRRWCDRSVAGNSMADRMVSLIDTATGRLREGAVTAPDDHTVILTLDQPDVTLLPSLSDYPALLVHRDFDAGGANVAQSPVGTGPYTLTRYAAGEEAVLTRRNGWWGGDVALEQITYRDLGIDPARYLEAIEVGEIDMVYDSTGAFVNIFDDAALVREEVLSGATLVFRVNRRVVPEDHPYQDARVRRALAMAVDNAVILELGYAGLGAVAENHHIGPMNPDYVDIGAPIPDPAAAYALMEEAGAHRFEHELISIDDDWNRFSADAVAAQLRDAGFQVKRRILTATDYWAGWQTHPFSCTAWNMRPLGLQVLMLAYASDGVWNETGFADPAFDALLREAKSAPDKTSRAILMAQLQQMLIDDGTIIQPYWRKLFLHHSVKVRGVRRHPTNEHHHDLWSVLG